MKTTGIRSIVLYILFFAFLGGIAYLIFGYCVNGSKWAMQPYNGHLYAGNSSVTLGSITDRNENVLAYTQEGVRYYSDSETVRRSLLHTVGDTAAYISTSVQYTMRAELSGYNIITGLNETVFSSFASDIRLTVDQNVCAAAYNGLSGKNGAVLVYNYKTGEILCKVSTPTFDPLYVPSDLDENSAYNGVYLDNTLSSSYTPGSVFKIVTAAAAMEKWQDTWQEITYYCEGSAELGGDRITCLRGEAHGTQNMSSAMGNSCNVYFANLSAEIGAEAMTRKAEEMGFNAEFRFGSVPICKSEFDLSNANLHELGWAGTGQYTVLANPYHMMVLMGAVANGGEYVQPKLMENTDLFSPLADSNRVLLPSYQAEQLKTLMRNTVQNYYGDYMFPEGMNVCAKTGTGEVGEGKGPNCWMVGFCDSEKYPYAFAAVVQDGAGGIETAGNLISQVLYSLA